MTSRFAAASGVVTRLLVRCDADEQIGLGHVTRAVAAAEALAPRLGAKPAFLGRPTQLFERFLRERSLDLRPVAGEGFASAEVCRALDEESVLLTDSYELDEHALSDVAATRARHVVIDDFAALSRWPCDVVVNPNHGARQADYPGAARVLTGTRYTLLRREVLASSPRDPNGRPHARRVLICLGGGRWSRDALALVTTLGQIAGNHLELRAPLPHSAPPGVAAFDPRMLPEQLRWADVGLLSGGVVKYEAAYCGLPALLVAVAPHQRDVASAFAKTGAARYLGELRAVEDGTVLAAIESLLAAGEERARMRRKATRLVDGRGAERVANAVEALVRREPARRSAARRAP